MNNRPKISSFSEQQLSQFLHDCFLKAGIAIKLEKAETKLLLTEVYKKQGWVFADTFSDAFSSYAACELPEMETVRPSASPLFIGRLIKAYTRKCKEKNSPGQKNNSQPSRLSPEEKYILFIQFIRFSCCIPENPDWVSLYEHLAETGKLTYIPEWTTWGFTAKWRYAMNEVKEWVYERYEIVSYKSLPGSRHY